MPLKQYLVLKKAVEIESIASRMTNLYDRNRAFADAKPLMEQLQKEHLSLLHNNKSGVSNGVSWDKDPNWKSQLMKLQA
jgi:hypothetical protein